VQELRAHDLRGVRDVSSLPGGEMSKTKLEIAVLLQAQGFEEKEALAVADAADRNSQGPRWWLEHAAGIEADSATNLRSYALRHDERATWIRKVVKELERG
jgi:hypothetical protein